MYHFLENKLFIFLIFKYGGNPVSMAIANACMEVIRNEKLQENAEEVGNYTKALLKDLQNKHDIIGDVRWVNDFLQIFYKFVSY